MSLLVIQRGSPIHGADQALLEEWGRAAARPEELVLVATSAPRAPAGAPSVSAGRDFFVIARDLIAKSSCEWVIVGTGGKLLPSALPRVRERLAATTAKACVFGLSDLDGVEDRFPTPPAAAVAFRRDALVAAPLDARAGSAASWTRVLELAPKGDVVAWPDAVATPFDPERIADSLAPFAFLAHRGELTRRQKIQLVGWSMHLLGDSRSAVVEAVDGLRPSYYDFLGDEAVRDSRIRMTDFSWTWGRRARASRTHFPLDVVSEPAGSALVRGTTKLPLREERAVARFGAEALRLRRGSTRHRRGKRVFGDRAWVQVEATVPAGKLCRVRFAVESPARLTVRFSWDEPKHWAQVHLPGSDRFRVRFGKGVWLSRDDDHVVRDELAFGLPGVEPEDRFIASPTGTLRIGLYSELPDHVFSVDEIAVSTFEHDGLLAP